MHFSIPSRVYFDKLPPGWLVWQDTLELYVPPGDDQSGISPSSWSEKDLGAIEAIRTTASKAEYWTKLATYFGEEKEVNYLIQYNVGSVKSIRAYV
jgi:proteasome activator subunit 4